MPVKQYKNNKYSIIITGCTLNSMYFSPPPTHPKHAVSSSFMYQLCTCSRAIDSLPTDTQNARHTALSDKNIPHRRRRRRRWIRNHHTAPTWTEHSPIGHWQDTSQSATKPGHRQHFILAREGRERQGELCANNNNKAPIQKSRWACLRKKTMIRVDCPPLHYKLQWIGRYFITTLLLRPNNPFLIDKIINWRY